VGAAVAVTLGGGTLGIAHAVLSSGQRSSFVPMPPCRLFDTRPAPDNVGSRATAIGAGETFTQQVTGTNGQCVIPDDAVAVAMNVTVVGGTAASYLTVYPADVPTHPLASNLNWVPGTAPTPNKVDTKLSPTGAVNVFNLTGTVNVLADVVGYYADHNHDDRYYTKAEVDQKVTGGGGGGGVPGPAGPTGQTGPPGLTGAAGLAGVGGANPGHLLTTVDVRPGTFDAVGYNMSATIGADGLPVMSYFEFTNGDLWVTHCNDVACAGQDETRSLVAAAGNVGQFSSIAIGTDGFPVVAFYDLANKDLMFAHCNDVACAGQNESVVTIDTGAGGDDGQYTSTAIGTDGNPIISYYDVTKQRLRVVHCVDIGCSTPVVPTIVDGGNVGQYSSIAIGHDGLPVISYYAAGIDNLRVAKCADVACSTSQISNFTGQGWDNAGLGKFSSLAIDPLGFPVISSRVEGFGVTALVVVRCGDPTCFVVLGTIKATDVDSVNQHSVGQYSSIAIGSDGLPVVSEYDFTSGDLRVVHCADLACDAANSGLTVNVIDTANDVGLFPSVTIGVDDLPLIAYQDASFGAVKVAHCANVRCIPNVRTR
jgi:hypothetical protein